MEKLKKGLVLLLAVFLVSGCVKRTVEMNIDKNGTVTVTGIAAVASDLASDDSLVLDQEDLEKLGYQVEEYKDEDMVGVKFTKTYKLEDISSDKASLVHLELLGEEGFDEQFKYQKVGDKTYKATFVFDTTGEYDESMAQYASQIEVKYSVTLPSEAKSHNADEVDGKTYTWNVTYGEKKDINYEFTLGGGSGSNSMLLWIGIAVAVVAIVVIVIVVMKKKGKGKPEAAMVQPYNNLANQNPQQPVTPIYPQNNPMNNGYPTNVPPTPSDNFGNNQNG